MSNRFTIVMKRDETPPEVFAAHVAKMQAGIGKILVNDKNDRIGKVVSVEEKDDAAYVVLDKCLPEPIRERVEAANTGNAESKAGQLEILEAINSPTRKELKKIKWLRKQVGPVKPDVDGSGPPEFES